MISILDTLCELAPNDTLESKFLVFVEASTEK